MTKEQLNEKLLRFSSGLSAKPKPLFSEGKVTRIIGLTIEAVGTKIPIGAYCEIVLLSGLSIEAEVVGFENDKLYLMPMGDTAGIQPGAKVVPTGKFADIEVGEQLLGRIVDGNGKPLDNKEQIIASEIRPMNGKVINPLLRRAISEPLDVGVRAINGLLTIGKGQRIGIFSGSGVGKSILLGMMSRYTSADVVVIGLIGERGREVKEFIEKNLGEQGLSRSVVVAAPADESPLVRLHGAWYATTIAEYFRDQGKDVLLLMDSLTRFAQAQREISLAIGEMPANKGYTPSVFAKLPKLVERAGQGHQQGSITAFYTVLAEGDDQQDPIVDSARAILDGHIILARELAGMGHYPAIDIENSISRVMPDVVSQEHLDCSLVFKRMISLYEQNKDLIAVGAYTPGQNPELDLAVQFYPQFMAYLKQGMNEKIVFSESFQQLFQNLELLKSVPNPS